MNLFFKSNINKSSKNIALFYVVAIGMFGAMIGCTTLSGLTGGASKKNVKPEPVFYAVAIISPTALAKSNPKASGSGSASLNNNLAGKIIFTEGFGKVKVEVEVQGLDPNSKHGFHIHEFGDCTADDASSAGGHYNPLNKDHGPMDGEMHHLGDMNNLEADKAGKAKAVFFISNVSLNGIQNSIVGRSVIIHKNEDDMITQPSGASGNRIGCGVIGIKHEY
jgi:Cu-Zn family superoxide dismutase